MGVSYGKRSAVICRSCDLVIHEMIAVGVVHVYPISPISSIMDRVSVEHAIVRSVHPQALPPTARVVDDVIENVSVVRSL